MDTPFLLSVSSVFSVFVELTVGSRQSHSLGLVGLKEGSPCGLALTDFRPICLL